MGKTDRIHGLDAIEYAEAHEQTLYKYADPVSGAKSGLSVEEALDICREDAGLVYVEIP